MHVRYLRLLTLSTAVLLIGMCKTLPFVFLTIRKVLFSWNHCDVPAPSSRYMPLVIVSD